VQLLIKQKQMKTVITFIFLFHSLYLFAQPAPIKWKSISIDNLKMESYGPNPEASAIVLCDYGEIYFDTNPNGKHLFLFYKRHVRIKILKKEGLKYAKIRIPFHDLHCEKFRNEASIIISGRVYNLLESGKVVSEKLKRKDITYRDSSNCYKIAEFTIPDVEVGSIIEYKYKTPTLDLVSPKSWYFQSEIPTVHSEFRIDVPNDFQYMISPVNIKNFDINEQQFYSKNVFFEWIRYYRGFSGYVRKIKSKVAINLSGKSYQLVKKNIAAFTSEKFIDLADNQKQKLNIHLVKIIRNSSEPGWDQLTHSLMVSTDKYYYDKTPEQRRMLPYPAAYIIYKLPSWEELNNDLLKNESFGLPLIMYWNYKSSLDSIIKGINAPEKKMVAIYDYIRKNIKWNGQYDIYANRVFNPFIGKVYSKITKKLVNEKSLRYPFENKTGTSSEINFILIYLLNKAGIEAHPVLVSTRGNGDIDKNIPDAKQFNHVIANANINGQQLFLDATDSLRPNNFLKQNCIGVEGLIVKKKGFEWVKVNNNRNSSTKTSSNLLIDDNLNITGSLKRSISGYDALKLRKKILSKPDNYKIIKNRIQKNHPDYSIGNIKAQNIKQEAMPLVIEADLSKKAKTDDKEIRINPYMLAKYTEDSFPDIIRAYPVFFENPFLKTYELNINIPKGYVAEYPQDAQYEVYGKNASFYYNVKEQSSNSIQVIIKLELKTNKFPAYEYNRLAEFFANVNNKLNEGIIIKKKGLD